MPNYRRAWVPGGTYFFTVAIAERSTSLLVDCIDDLRAAFRAAHVARPFVIDVIAIQMARSAGSPALSVDPAGERCGLSGALGAYQDCLFAARSEVGATACVTTHETGAWLVATEVLGTSCPR